MSGEGKRMTDDRIAALKRVREERKESLEEAMAKAKANDHVRKKVMNAMKAGAGTVPEIAGASGIASHEVLWHVTAMKKYDQVLEEGQESGYYRYRLAEGVKP